MAFSGDQAPPHIALIPSSGMGHLNPLCRLATTLATRGCHVSLFIFHPMVSSAESNSITTLLSTFPSIHPIHLNIVPLTGPGNPYILQFEAIRQSAHLLLPHLTSSSPPITSIIVDVSLVSTLLPAISPTGISTFIYFISSASMLALCAYFPTHIESKSSKDHVEVPGVGVIPMASLPLPLHNLSDLFTTQFIDNGRALVQAKGILINTFEALEPETLTALNNGVVVPGLPPVIAVGPLKQFPLGKGTSSPAFPWLDAQKERSVVYVNFSRVVMSVEQIREVGVGLEKSGVKFLWVIRTKKVDKEEVQMELKELLGEELAERIKESGSMVMHEWVEQEEILKHGAVGGFLSHTGWNSVTEAAMHGVRMLAWPQGGGDQRVIAEVVRRSGLGIWVEEWSWEDEGKVVKGEEIAEKVKELMESPVVRSSAARVAAEAVKAVGEGGSSEKNLAEFIAKLKG